MWTWWVSRSSSAPVSRSEANTPVHSSNGRLLVTMDEPRSAVTELDLLGQEFGVGSSFVRNHQWHARCLVGHDNLAHLLGAALAHTEDVVQTPLLQSGDGGGTDHAAIGNDTETLDGEAVAQPLDDGDQRGDVGGIAGPHLRADRPSLLIDDDADDHLVQMRPIILGVTAFTERGATLTLEIDRGGVHEHHGEIAEQRPSAGEQPLLHEILHTTCDERAVGLIGRRQLLAEPGHGAVEMM